MLLNKTPLQISNPLPKNIPSSTESCKNSLKLLFRLAYFSHKLIKVNHKNLILQFKSSVTFHKSFSKSLRFKILENASTLYPLICTCTLKICTKSTLHTLMNFKTKKMRKFINSRTQRKAVLYVEKETLLPVNSSPKVTRANTHFKKRI